MSSVTGRIKQIKQPRGGYLRLAMFDANVINDGNVLSDLENIHASLVGMAVDYLTRLQMGEKRRMAFQISLQGARLAKEFGKAKATREAATFLRKIKGVDDKSVINACKICTFDVWTRDQFAALTAKGANEINPDSGTIKNIQIMVQRSLDFWRENGPITKSGFTFEPSGYTSTVDSGDGDFLTKNTLWDLKISKSKPTSKHTLQLLVYWIMGQHSGKKEFRNITNLGIFNPRLNVSYTLPVSKIGKDIIKAVETEVICY